MMYGVWLLVAAELYFFENNTGTRAILAASLLLPAVSAGCAAISAHRLSLALDAPEQCAAGGSVLIRPDGQPGATAEQRERLRLCLSELRLAGLHKDEILALCAELCGGDDR